MITIFPAAGYCKRFGGSTPKYLLEINGVSILDRLLEKVSGEKIVIVNRENKKYFKDYKDKASIWQTEDSRGSLYNIWSCINQFEIKNDICIICCDLIFNFSLDGFLLEGRMLNEITIPIMKANKETMLNAGSVIFNKRKRVTDFCEHGYLSNSEYSELGIYFIPGRRLKLINRCAYLDSPGYLLEHVYKYTPIHVHIVKGMWFHINTKEDYEEAKDAIADTDL